MQKPNIVVTRGGEQVVLGKPGPVPFGSVFITETILCKP